MINITQSMVGKDMDITFCFYRNDVCECGEGEECLCEVLADYSRACAAHGVFVDWRNASTCGTCDS